jgi:hypothetical protein
MKELSTERTNDTDLSWPDTIRPAERLSAFDLICGCEERLYSGCCCLPVCGCELTPRADSVTASGSDAQPLHR